MNLIKIKSYLDNLPKAITSTNCWIPERYVDLNDYIRVTIDGDRYLLSRLSMCVYHNVYYFNHEILATHKCNNPKCFNPEHVMPGSNSDNVLDSVALGTHRNSSKDKCPKCGSPYSKQRSGKKQVWSRRCLSCKNTRRNKLRRIKKNESI